VVVEDWADTFRLPPHLVRAWDPGPGWVVPAGVVVGLVLVVATWAAGSTVAWQVVVSVAVTTFVAAWVVLALGGTRLEGPASAVATAAWIWAAWVLATGTDVARPLAAALVAVGAVGQCSRAHDDGGSPCVAGTRSARSSTVERAGTGGSSPSSGRRGSAT
jgi:hypothetical protein